MLVVIVIVPVLASAAEVTEAEQGAVFAIIEENDLVVDTDRDYTQGIKVSYLHRDNRVPGFVRSISEHLPALGYQKQIDKVGLTIGQNIYTPGDISDPNLIEDDRPYAGWLYAGLVHQRRGIGYDRVATLEQLQLDLGVIGPESLAEDAQTWVHHVRGYGLPRGWDHQLDTEFGFALKYYRAWRVPLVRDGEHLQFLPHFGFSLGNVETSLRLGGMVRLGWNLPEDYGPQTISSLLTMEGSISRKAETRAFATYLFAGAEGWLVGYSAFLDGNLFQDSHSVDREPLVTELRAGAAILWSHFEIGLMGVFRSREYSTQEEEHSFGSLYGKVKW